jgi:hypothetical protein
MAYWESAIIEASRARGSSMILGQRGSYTVPVTHDHGHREHSRRRLLSADSSRRLHLLAGQPEITDTVSSPELLT